MMDLKIRRALNTENEVLTDISFSAKHYWNYPKEYYHIWKNELMITPHYIDENKVFVAEKEDEIVGYFSIIEVSDDFFAGKVFVKQGFWLEHVFIRPAYIERGIGRQLMEFAKSYCKDNKIMHLYIFSDPNAIGFYEKLGAVYLCESLSSIENRTVSLFELSIV